MPQTSTQTQQQQSQSNTSPWSVQTPYLQDAFNQAQGTYNAGASSVYNGQQVAQFTPDQLRTFQAMVGAGNNQTTPNTEASVGGNVAQAGQGGLTNALSFLNNFKPTDNTNTNITNAGLYANNPAISDQVTAAMRDATNTANEQTLPGIARNAAATGNINSNRTAIQQGIVQRGLQNDASDVSAALRGSAYNTGLGLSEQNQEANATNALGAAGTALSGGTNAVNAGVGALSSSVNDTGSLYNIANIGGAGQQTAAQAQIDNAQQMANSPTDRMAQLLQQYFGIVGGTGYGGTTDSSGTSTGTTTQQASPLTIAGSALGTVGSLMTPGLGGTSAIGNLYSLFNGKKPA